MTQCSFTVRHSIIIARPCEEVWDYTQNYGNRSAWDTSVLEASVLDDGPPRLVRLKMRGNTTMTFVYKQDERPRQTSLAAIDIRSPLIEAAGGSWQYGALPDGATRWTQTNYIALKPNWMNRLLWPVFRRYFAWLTIKAMKRVKGMLEAAG